MDFIDLLKHIPTTGEATYISLALFALWGLYKLGMRYMSIVEHGAEREAKAAEVAEAAARQERKEALEREAGREAVHREATEKAIIRLNDSVKECEADRQNLRKELEDNRRSFEESRKFFARDLDVVKRNVKAITDELIAVKSSVGTTLAESLPDAPGSQTAATEAHQAPPAAKQKAKSTKRKAK